MPNLILADLAHEIEANVRRALAEDIGSGDITAQLIPAERLAQAKVITRESAVICGTAWVDAVFRQLDPRVAVHWHIQDGQRAEANQVLFELEGPARALLSGERSALNFLQTLSAVATRSQHYADHIATEPQGSVGHAGCGGEVAPREGDPAHGDRHHGGRPGRCGRPGRPGPARCRWPNRQPGGSRRRWG